MIWGSALEQKTPKATGKRRVSLHVTLGKGMREFDYDAPDKSLYDAMKHAKLIVDDSVKYLEKGPLTFSRDSKAWGTKITLEELWPAPAITLIKERRQEIQLEIRRLTNLVIGLDMALEILEGKPPEVAAEASSSSALNVNDKPAAPPRKRKTADERKEEVAALLEQGKSVEEIAAATGLKESSVKLYWSILKARKRENPPVASAPTTASPPKKRRGRPPKKRPPAAEGEYPIIGRTIGGEPQFGSMRMKVIGEKVVDGHKVKVLPPGYAQGASPQKNVSVSSWAKLGECLGYM